MGREIGPPMPSRAPPRRREPVYLVGLLPALDAAALGGPLVAAAPLGAGAPVRQEALGFAPLPRPAPPLGQRGAAGDSGAVLVPLQGLV